MKSIHGNLVPVTPSISKTDPVNGAISIAVAKTDTALDPVTTPTRWRWSRAPTGTFSGSDKS
jgi:hypothetical protein